MAGAALEVFMSITPDDSCPSSVVPVPLNCDTDSDVGEVTEFESTEIVDISAGPERKLTKLDSVVRTIVCSLLSVALEVPSVFPFV